MSSFFSKSKEPQKTTQKQFNEWVKSIIVNESPGPKIIVYNFGIFQSKNGYKLYLAGFESYEIENDDWAVGLGDFIPENNYFDLPDKEFTDLDWESVQKRVIELITNLKSTNEFGSSFLNDSRAITTGFDDGDLIRIK